jgi:hypothetical protein
MSHKKVLFFLTESERTEFVTVHNLSYELNQQIVGIDVRRGQCNMPPVVSMLDFLKLELSVPLKR